MRKNIILLLIFQFLIVSNLHSQSSVYVCINTGISGYAYGNINAHQQAFDNCMKAGGNAPHVVFTTSNKGFGAVAIGKDKNGKQIVGASGGYKTQKEADQEAMEQCKFHGGLKCIVYFTWHDKPDKATNSKDDFWNGASKKTSKNKNKDDFWSGANSNKSSNSNKNNDFWTGKGTISEEDYLKKHTTKPKSNQFIGEIESKTKYIKIVCRDHGDEDGDRVSIRNNKQTVKSNLTLRKSSQTINIELKFGMNRIDFKALNQGTSGPNTAEFKVYDDRGKLLSSKEWNILTGYTATLLIVKL